MNTSPVQVADAETRERLWPEVTSKASNDAYYQKKTDREITVVRLHPAS